MHYAVPRILYNARALQRLYTDVYADCGLGWAISRTPGLARVDAFRRLRDRSAVGLPKKLVTSFGTLGLRYWARLRRATTEAERLNCFLWISDAFAQAVRREGLGTATAVYGFNSSSRSIFEMAKAQGMRTVLEQTIAPKLVETEILSRHASLQANACGTTELSDFAALEQDEWEMADNILCASEFVLDGLVRCGVAREKCQVVPYGVDLSRFNMIKREQKRTGSLRILFVGGVGERKGISTLFSAMQKLKGTAIECRVVGPVVGDPEVLMRTCPTNTRVVGPVPRTDIAREMLEADVFCLPSLCEGSATVTYEALAAGLPVVTTHNAGSIVRDGLDGILVPVADSGALAQALLRLSKDPELRQTMSDNARNRSAEGSMMAYQSRLISALGV